MSLRMHLGRRGSPLLERPSYARMLRLEHPVLLPEEMAALRNVAGFSTVTLDAVWDPTRGVDGLRPALTALRRARGARGPARARTSSSSATAPRTRRRAPIPMLLAIGAVRQHLVHTGLRARVGLVAEAGDAFDIHHFATLIGYGAEAVHPWLALETLDGLFGEAREPSRREREARRRPGPSPAEARGQFRAAAEKGLLKILSKMGISTLSLLLRRADLRGARPGPRGDRAPASTGTASPHRRHRLRGDRGGRPGAPPRGLSRGGGRRSVALPDHGRVRFRKEGEDHGWAPPVVVALQQAVKAGDAGRRTAASWSKHGRAAAGRARATCSTCATGTPVPLEEVEPVEAIRRAVRLVGHVARRALARGARHAVHRDEPDGRPLQLGRGRRGPAQLPRLRQRRPGRQPDQAGGLGPLRRHHRVPRPRRGAGDQDRPGRQARRRRPAPGAQGHRPDRAAAARGARRSR